MTEQAPENRRKLAATLATVAAQTANDILDSSSDSSNHSDPRGISSSSETEEEDNAKSINFVAALIRRDVPKSSTFFEVLEQSDDIEMRRHFRMNRGHLPLQSDFYRNSYRDDI